MAKRIVFIENRAPNLRACANYYGTSIDTIEKRAHICYDTRMRNYFTYPIYASCLPNGFELNSFAANNIRRVYRHHHEFYELYFFLSGHAEFLLQDRVIALHNNTLLLIPPGYSHSLRFLDEDSVYQRSVLWIQPELLAGVSGEDWSEPLELRLSSADGVTIGQLLSLLDGEQTKLERDLSAFVGRDTVCADYIRLIFTQITRLRERSGNANAFLRRVQAYLSAHLSEDLRAETIAAALHMGKTHLMRRFHAESGVTLHQYIVKLRLQRARRLLSQGVGAGESAAQSGFSDYTTFYKAFVRTYGLSPSSFGEGFQIASTTGEAVSAKVVESQ